MFTKIYWIHTFAHSAKLGIMARPRGNDWLDGEIANLKKQGLGVLVSLLEQEEALELGLLNQEAVCKRNGIDFINFPITDRDVPKANDNVDRLINLLTAKLTGGTSVVVHCRMGIGRSSIIAASVLLKTGLQADTIIENICKIRGLKVPDTDGQLKWLKARQ